jgi:hypothetical protein
MIDIKAKETFWEVVVECLIAIHGFAKPEAHRRSRDLRTRIESAPAGMSSDIFYHAEPFDVACDIAGRPLDAAQYRQQYDSFQFRFPKNDCNVP